MIKNNFSAKEADEKTEDKTTSSTEDKKDNTSDNTGALLEDKDKYELTLEAMLKAGMHFGHKKSRWNPKMKKYIFGVRNGVHILDLEKTIELFRVALEQIAGIVERGGSILLVGTKKQAQNMVKAVGDKAELPYVNERWLGGTFTNFEVVKKRIKFLTDHREILEKKKLADMTKLEGVKLEKKLNRIEKKMGGLKRMIRLPEAIFILDVNQDKTAVDEAKKVKVKSIGLVDTNSDPEAVDFPIPANDDALSSLKYVLGLFLKTVLKAKNKKTEEGAKEAPVKNLPHPASAGRQAADKLK